MNLQPRQNAGTFDTTGATAHEKARFHAGAAHLDRVNAAVARHNGDTALAATHDARAAAHDEASKRHQTEAMKP